MRQYKQPLSRMMRWSLMRFFMDLGIRLLVPRHRIGVALVALNEEKQVFMLRHVFRPQVPWGLPGGWMSRRESPERCILREIKEETGLAVELGPVVHVSRDPQMANITIFYMGRLWPGPLSLSAEILDAAWFDLNELPNPIFPSALQAIEQALYCHSNWVMEQKMGV